MTHAVSHETLMRYLDGELAPDERARVEDHLSGCAECRREVEVFRSMKRDLAAAAPDGTDPGGSVWRDVRRRLTWTGGWALVLAGAALWAGWAVWTFVTAEGAVVERLAVGATLLGLALLLVHVGLERWREWKTDPYRDVQR